MSIDHFIAKNLYFKTEAAKARLALLRLCQRYQLVLDQELEDYDERDLTDEMQWLERDARAEVASVIRKADARY